MSQAASGILSMASPLLQEVFGGRLINVSATFDQLTPEQKGQIAAIAAGFTGLLSLFNIAGRIFLGPRVRPDSGVKQLTRCSSCWVWPLYASIPWTAATESLALFVAFFCVISVDVWRWLCHRARISCRPLRHTYGRAIHAPPVDGLVGRGRVGASAGPTTFRDYQLDHGIARAQVYSVDHSSFWPDCWRLGSSAIGWSSRDPKHYMSASSWQPQRPNRVRRMDRRRRDQDGGGRKRHHLSGGGRRGWRPGYRWAGESG